MACCGQKRTEINQSSWTAKTTTTVDPSSTNSAKHLVSQGSLRQNQPPPGTPSASITLRYLQTAPILVRGPITGQAYRFSGPYPEQFVDARDVETLLQTRLFRRM